MVTERRSHGTRSSVLTHPFRVGGRDLLRGLAALRLAGRATWGDPAGVMAFTISLPIDWAARIELPSADRAVEPFSRVASVTPPKAVASVPVARVITPLPVEALLERTLRPRGATDFLLFFSASGFRLALRVDVTFSFCFLVAMVSSFLKLNAAYLRRSGVGARRHVRSAIAFPSVREDRAAKSNLSRCHLLDAPAECPGGVAECGRHVVVLLRAAPPRRLAP